MTATFLRLIAIVITCSAVGCVAQYEASRSEPGTGTSRDEGGATDEDTEEASLECDVEQLSCGGDCIDAGSDPLHCGACFNECREQTLCVAGLCRRPCDAGCMEPPEICVGSFCECTPGFTDCSGGCIDLNTDSLHCGQCDRACPQDQACGDGQCRDASCPGFADVCGGACTDTSEDPLHCGDCFRECGAEEVCADGECYEFNVLPGEVCQECPCEAVCDPRDDRCCFSELLDTEICVFGPECP